MLPTEYRGADKSLARPNWKNNWKVAIFRLTRRSLLPRRPGWTDDLLNFFLSGLQKLRVWSLQFVSFLVRLRTYQHPGTSDKSMLNQPSLWIPWLKHCTEYLRTGRDYHPALHGTFRISVTSYVVWENWCVTTNIVKSFLNRDFKFPLSRIQSSVMCHWVSVSQHLEGM